MYGQCKNCKKLFSCQLPHKWGCGFCATDFEPKQKRKADEEREPARHMAWKQLRGTEWEARGQCGVFKIERAGGKFWSHYASEDTAFKLLPKTKLSEAKALCEGNYYWE